MAKDKKVNVTIEVEEEQAREIVKNWLDARRVPNSRRKQEEVSKRIKDLEGLVCDGLVTINPDTNQLTYTLRYPAKNNKNEEVESITFEPRVSALKMNNAHNLLSNIPNVKDELAIAVAATGMDSTTVKTLDTGDVYTIQTPMIFFAT